MRYLIIGFLVVWIWFPVQRAIAQQYQEKEGYVEVIQDSRVDSLLQKHIYLNQFHQTLEGYRIQIFFDAGNNSRINAYRVRDEFLGQSPDSAITVYVSFKEPYYRVRVGDFRSRLDAEGFLKLIKPIYPNAFPIKDQINLPKI